MRLYQLCLLLPVLLLLSCSGVKNNNTADTQPDKDGVEMPDTDGIEPVDDVLIEPDDGEPPTDTAESDDAGIDDPATDDMPADEDLSADDIPLDDPLITDDEEPVEDDAVTEFDDLQPDDPTDDTPLPEQDNAGDLDTADADVDMADTQPESDIVPDITPDIDIVPDIVPDVDIDSHICTPEEVVACPYTGDPNTKDVGPCKAGTKTCALNGLSWSDCTGEVLPEAEICGNGIDENCNDDTDENVDLDGDGWGSCAGDCCDSVLQCADPAKVNPGAFELPDDGVDNDCNDEIDEDPRVSCSAAAKFSATTAADLVNGLDICKTSTGGSWGIVGTPTLTRAGGTGTVDNKQIAVMQQFGTNASNAAIFGGTMASLSSGRARDMNDPDPTADTSYTYYTGDPPTDFIAAHSNSLPTTKSGCPSGSGANDGVMLSVTLKVPTNALSFSFNFRFFSQEYWRFTCNNFNDFFIAMLYTNATGVPADKNISFDSNGSYISVNSNAFFTVCQPKTGYPCPDGVAALAGTGYGEEYSLGEEYDMGGATKWLATAATVLPGETITLKFVVWDTTDQNLDSLVIIDNFKWSVQGTGGGGGGGDPTTYECWDLNKNQFCDLPSEGNPYSEDLSGDNKCTERDC